MLIVVGCFVGFLLAAIFSVVAKRYIKYGISLRLKADNPHCPPMIQVEKPLVQEKQLTKTGSSSSSPQRFAATSSR